ncbi:hypothetical protein NW752_008540 [Fusarium irregulare]|uniref:Uncharacterized protein n=1 Tax=Fusarium irregulare TaxID=2494466 RepID=A0A9W8UDM0_9HYPO|nr:hypothetical protein NW752_008540 [Fusarium irregulare]KAJ4020468.1 hypothetical protein NW766_001955 [Fusarium irregulare]
MSSAITSALQKFLQPILGNAEHAGANLGHINVPPHGIKQEELVQSMRKIYRDSGCKKTSFLVVPDSQTRTKFEAVSDLDDEEEMEDVPSQEISLFSDLLETLRANRNVGEQKGWLFGSDTIQNTGKIAEVLPRSIIVIMWLDSEMPADCALAVAGIVKWATEVSLTDPSADISILTMAADKESNVLSDVVASTGSNSKVENLDLAALVHQDPVTGSTVLGNYDTKRSLGHVLQACQEMPQVQRLIISFDEVFSSLMVRYTRKPEWKFIEYIFVTPDTFEYTLRRMTRLGNFKTLVVTFPSTPRIPAPKLVALHELYVVTGCKVQHAEVWDDECLQVVTKSRPTSREERRRQLWWSYQPDSTNRRSIITLAPNDHLFLQKSGPQPRLVENAHLGGFVAAVVDLASWGMDMNKLLSCFVRYSLRSEEMMKRLTIQGVVAKGSVSLSEKEADVFRWTLSYFDYDYRLSLLVALDADTLLRSIKVHVAVLLKHGILDLIRIRPDSSQAGTNLRHKILQECRKTFHRLRYDGIVWLILGLLGQTESDASGAVKDLLSFDKNKVNHRISRIEDLLLVINDYSGLNISEAVSWEFGELDQDHVRQIQSHFLRAYIFQLTMVHPDMAKGTGSSDVNPVFKLASSLSRCSVKEADSQSLASLYSPSFLIKGDRHTAYVIAHNLERSEDGKLSLGFWTSIPGFVTAEWLSQWSPDLDLFRVLNTWINYTY